MGERIGARIITILTSLAQDPQLRLERGGEQCRVPGLVGKSAAIPVSIVHELRSHGLLTEREPGRFSSTPALAAWLKRRGAGELPFRMQHGTIAKQRTPDASAAVLVDLEESPVGTLARTMDRGGRPWLSPHSVTAAERLRRDFEIGQLRPRVTANWSAAIATGRRSGGLAELTDMAVAARLRFDRAMHAVGPEFSGILIDICCFLKGLELVERERQWPARAAKLVLRLALEALARHYGIAPQAEGRSSSQGVRHWGAEDYRPEIS
jgi:hypothetical protein